MSTDSGHGIGTTVLMLHVDRLAPFGLWFRQLWAESLGKGGKGTTPLRSMGAIDQHSQLQLDLAEPRTKCSPVAMLDQAGQGIPMPPDLVADHDATYPAAESMGDLVAADQRHRPQPGL